MGLKAFRQRDTRVNQIVLPISNYGPMGNSGYNEWPQGSGERYVYNMAIWIGTMIDTLPLVSCGYDFYGANCDMCAGPPEHVDDYAAQGEGAHPEDSLYFSTEIYDPSEWPVRDQNDNPLILSAEDIWCEFNDLWEARHQWAPNTWPLRLHMEQTVFGWGDSLHENMVFVLYKIKNVSDDTLKDLYVGFGCDMDIGNYTNDLVGCDIERSLGWTYTPN